MQRSHDSFTESLNALRIKQVSASECLAIANQWADAIARFHGVTFAEGTVDRAVEVASRHIPAGVLPATAIDMLENAAVFRKVAMLSSSRKEASQGTPMVSIADMDQVLAENYGVQLGSDESQEQTF